MTRRKSGPYRIRRPRQAPPAAAARPRSWFRSASGRVHRDLEAAELPARLAEPGGFLWVDLDNGAPEPLSLLDRVFHLHPLVVEDAASPNGRAKFEEFPGYVFVVVRAVRYATETEDPHDIETFNLACVLGPNYLVTIHGAHAPGVDVQWERVERSPDLLERGPARTMHAVLDATVDGYFPIVDQLDEFLDSLEQHVFVRFDDDARGEIFAVKRLVLQLKRHLAPQREVFGALTNRPCALVPPDVQLYFRDVYDHVIRLNESLDAYRDLVGSTMESYLTQVSNRLNVVTKGLTVVATLSVPFVVVSGMWGMNFAEVPLSHWPHGFWLMFAIQLGLGALLVWLLRRRGLL